MLRNSKMVKVLCSLVLCVVLIVALLPLNPVAAAVDNAFGMDFNADEIGTAYGNFVVTESDGRRYIRTNAAEFGATGNLYASQLGTTIQESFEISVEFMFPAGTEGILWLYMKGMSAVNDFQMMDVHYAGGVTHIYAQDGASLGDIADTSALGVQVSVDTWHTMKVVKDNALYKLYLDNVQVLEYTYENTNNAPTEIYLMQFLFSGPGACYDTLTLKPLEAEKATELNMDFSAVDVGTANGNFAVAEQDGNRYLESSNTGFGATVNLYNGELGDAIANSFELSADFMFPAGSEGIVWLYMKGMSDKNDFQMMDVSYTGGITRVYAQDIDNLCDVADTSALGIQVQADTWYTMRVVKDNALYTLYLEDVKVAEYSYGNTNRQPTEIYLMQFLTAGDKARFDNLILKTYEADQVALESIMLSSSSAQVARGSAVSFLAQVMPANASGFGDIEWYVKAPGESEFIKQEANGVSFSLTAEKVGDYYVYAQIGEIKSSTKYVTVVEKKPFEVLDTSGWKPFFSENFDNTEIWAEGIGWGGQNSDTYKSDGKGKVHHLPGDPAVKVGVAWNGSSFPVAYVMETDVTLSENSHGIVWYCMENFFVGEVGKWTSVGINFQGDEWFAYISSDTYGELAKSDGSVNIKELCGYNQEFKLRMYKHNEGVVLYVNDTEVLRWETTSSQSSDTGITWINVLSLLDGANDTIAFDNFQTLADMGGGSAVEVVTLTTSGSKNLTVGETITLECQYYPQAITVNSVEWYLNGEKIDNTNMLYTFNAEEEGEYLFKVVIDGVESEEVKITVQANDTDEPTEDNIWTWIVRIFTMIVDFFKNLFR